MTPITATPRPRIKKGQTVILLTMSLGVLIAQIDTSVVNLAIKEIGASLDAGVTALQWVVDAYNLVYASLLLTGGTLADLYGRRRVFTLGIGLFTFGSLVCGLAPNTAVLVAGRAVAGLGAALEIPTSLAILTVAYPVSDERTRALGVWASCNGLAFIIGPTLGGGWWISLECSMRSYLLQVSSPGMSFGDNFNRLLGMHGLTSRQAAELLDVSPQTISSWLNSRGQPRFSASVKIAEASRSRPIDSQHPTSALSWRRFWAAGSITNGLSTASKCSSKGRAVETRS